MTSGRRRMWPMVAAGCVILGCLLIGVLQPGLLAEGMQDLLGAARDSGPAGWIGFAVLQLLVAASGILPASLLGIAAGTAYGLALGFALAAVSTMIGALLAFALSRSLFRDAIARMLARRPGLDRFDALLAQDGWRIVCLLRISPVMPFAATSYALGMSSIGVRAYVIGTLASLPALLGYVFIGTLADDSLSALHTGAGTLRWALLGIGVVATLVLTLVIGRLLRRALAPAAAPADPALGQSDA